MLRRWLPNILLTLFSVVLALGAAEIALRVSGVTPTTDRMASYQFDPTLGWKTRSKFKFYRSSLYYGHFNYYDALGHPTTAEGFRNADTSSSEPAVALLGDSFTESYYVPYEQSFPFLLDQKLESARVLNLGVSGYSTDQELLSAREGLKGVPVKQIVVMFFPYNDLPYLDSDDYQGYAKPYFTDDLSTPANLPLAEKSGKGETGGKLTQRLRNTALYTVLRPLVRRNLGHLREWKMDVAAYDPAEMKKALGEIRRIADEHPEAETLSYYIPLYQESQDAEVFKKNLAMYEEACRASGVRCADMRELIAAEADPQRLYIPEDGHFTPYGAGRVAEHLYSLLTSASSSMATP